MPVQNYIKLQSLVCVVAVWMPLKTQNCEKRENLLTQNVWMFTVITKDKGKISSLTSSIPLGGNSELKQQYSCNK